MNVVSVFRKQMYKSTLALGAVMSLAGGGFATAQETAAPREVLTTYTNPTTVPLADPWVLKEGDTYYLYGTTDSDYGRGFDVYTSTDMVGWTRAGKCYEPTSSSWGSHSFWAPEVLKKDGKFYLHFTVYNREERRRNICIAVGDSPLGPFTDYAGPLFNEEPFDSVIDSHIYRDPKSGEYSIYCSPEKVPPSRILGARLTPDFKTVATSPTAMLTAEYGWEDLWIEGPIIHEHEGMFYMLYSGGAFWEAEYSLGYATAPSPLGPWTKSAANPVLKNTAEVEGPGHNGLAYSPDGKELFVFYHVHGGDATINRYVAMDRIVFADVAGTHDALTIPNAPTTKPQPLPGGSVPRLQAASDEFESGLDMRRWQIVPNFPENWELTTGALTITTAQGDFWRTHDTGQNLFLQSAPAGDYDIITSVSMNARYTNEQAFLTIWQDDDNYVTLAAAKINFQDFAVTREVMGKADTALSPNDIGWPVCLKIEKRGNNLGFFASADGKEWKEVCRPSTLGNIEPRYIGLGAWSPGVDERRARARFDFFRVEKR